MQSTSAQAGGLRGTLTLEDVTVDTPDISEYLFLVSMTKYPTRILLGLG